MGAWAVATLSSLIDGHDEVLLLGAHPVLLDCPIIERASVAAPSR